MIEIVYALLLIAFGFGLGRVHHPANLTVANAKAEIAKIEAEMKAEYSSIAATAKADIAMVIARIKAILS